MCDLLHRYHSNDEIKDKMAEIENKFRTIASFDANDNEFSMNYPQLRITKDVSVNINLTVLTHASD